MSLEQSFRDRIAEVQRQYDSHHADVHKIAELLVELAREVDALKSREGGGTSR
jgi:hypothetical protein